MAENRTEEINSTQLEVLDATHQSQGLVGYSRRRVRQVRRIDLQFVTPTLPGAGNLWKGVVEKSSEWLEQAREIL